MTNPTPLPVGQADELMKLVDEALDHQKMIDFGGEGWTRHIDALIKVKSQIAAQATAAQERAVGIIYSLANDLANNDPAAIGSVSTAPYMANALAIYSEYLKGENFERIDWRELKLPTLERLAAQSKELGELS